MFKDRKFKFRLLRITSFVKASSPLSKPTFKIVDVGNPEHPNYKDMIEIYHRLPVSNNIRHNLTIE